MIHSFSCKNFYSFKEKVTLNFTVNKNAPKNNSYINSSKERLSKVEAVIGPNASGKTNLLKVLPFLKWIIVDSYNSKPEKNIPVQPFAFSNSNKPSEFSVVFEINKKIYTYFFRTTQKRILMERLEKTAFVREKMGTQKLFLRKWNPNKKKYDFEDSNFKLPKGFDNVLRSNASIISSAVRLNHQESKTITNYWQKVKTNVVEAGWTGDNFFSAKLPQWVDALQFYSNNENLKKKAEKLLANFDIGLNEILFEKEKGKNKMKIKDIRAQHLINGKKYELPIHYESSGTKQLFILLKIILSALDKGGIAVIDEFDVNLHPEIIIALFDLFIQPETNPKNAQILISTHSLQLLNKIDKYQIVLVEKEKSGISDMWRLDEMSNIRPDENYYAKYMAGAYGATPKI